MTLKETYFTVKSHSINEVILTIKHKHESPPLFVSTRQERGQGKSNYKMRANTTRYKQNK